MKSLSVGSVPFGIYPWEWSSDESASFDALTGGLLVAPILQALILNRFPTQTLAWVARVVARFPFDRIVPAHLTNDLAATPAEFDAAFDFLRPQDEQRGGGRPKPLDADLALLRAASKLCTRFKLLRTPGVEADAEREARRALEARGGPAEMPGGGGSDTWPGGGGRRRRRDRLSRSGDNQPQGVNHQRAGRRVR